MRVVHLIAPGKMGGAENVILDGVEALREENVDARILLLQTEHEPRHQMAEEAHRRKIPFGILRGNLQRSINRSSIVPFVVDSIVHSHGRVAAWYALRTRAYSKGWIAHLHGFLERDERERIYNRIERTLVRQSDEVICVSTALCRFGGNAAHWHHIPNGRSFHPASATSSIAKTRFLFLGRLSKEKGVDVLIRALVGTGHCVDLVGDGDEHNELRELVDSLKLHPQVRFLGHQNDVSPYLSRCSALVLPSRTEGMPLCILEAQFAGVPVIATDVGDVRKALLGDAHILVPPDNVNAFKTAMDVFSVEKQERKRKAKKLAKRAQAFFSMNRWASQVAGLYDVIEQKNRTA
ncbi:MAG: glycosyltransferase family 4 protein [Deltaproteobacteria bacterium]|nr:glycosyltransferase family 4 protein [Deltaproteobacteria bacterium]